MRMHSGGIGKTGLTVFAGAALLTSEAEYYLKTPALDNKWKGEIDFFLPALKEIRNEAQNMSPNAKRKKPTS